MVISIEQAHNGLIVKTDRTTVHGSIESALLEVLAHIHVDGKPVTDAKAILDQVIKKQLNTQSSIQ